MGMALAAVSLRRRPVGALALTLLVLAPVAALAAFSYAYPGFGGPAEMFLFGEPGADILTGRWNQVFSDARVQAGAFELVPYGIAHLLDPSHTGWIVFYAVAFLATAGVLVSGSIVLLREQGARVPVIPLVAVGAVALVTEMVPWAFDAGHPAQIVVPVLWVTAGVAVRRGRPALAAVLVGLSAGWEVWGILGVPVLLVASPLRRAVHVAVTWGSVACATAVATYLPFAVAGPFEMFGFAWPVSEVSLYALVAPDLGAFPWHLRLLQAVVALAAGSAVAIAVRRTPHGVWLVPLAVLVTRLALDPLLYPYYWLAPQTVALLAAAFVVSRRDVPAVAGVAVSAALLWVVPATPLVQAWLLVLVVVGILPAALQLTGARRSRAVGVEPVPAPAAA